jgi:ribose-phosphate pyrophosphokinase
MAPPLQLFALSATADLGGRIAADLKIGLAAHEEREFEDGEHKSRPLDDVSGNDVYVIQSLHSAPQQSANDKLCRLLFFIGALKDAGAARVTAVVPYLCYARKDRRTKPNDPVTTRYMAALFESVGTDCIVTLEVHKSGGLRKRLSVPDDHADGNAAFCRLREGEPQARATLGNLTRCRGDEVRRALA